MTQSSLKASKRSIGQFSLAIATLIMPCLGLEAGEAQNSKTEQTPYFWQRDPEAKFPNQGLNHCAPVSIADGLIYLAKARKWNGLVTNTDHNGQIALINELAADMNTDPKEGTNPDKILTGLLRYIKKRGYSFDRLELVSWRPVSATNKKYKTGTKPNWEWMSAAAKDPDTVQILNFGWYKRGADGTIKRYGGHWVNVVGVSSTFQSFDIRNPFLNPEQQCKNTNIALKLVDKNFAVGTVAGPKFNMSGYYQAAGFGLPFSPQSVSAAVLDSVIVFKISKD